MTRSDADEAAARHRRAAELLGELLPDTTSDERSDEVAERDTETGRDAEMRRNVPPHHGSE